MNNWLKVTEPQIVLMVNSATWKFCSIVLFWFITHVRAKFEKPQNIVKSDN